MTVLIVVGVIVVYVVGWGIATRQLYHSLNNERHGRTSSSDVDYAAMGIVAAICGLAWPLFAPFLGLGRLLHYLDERNRARQG